MGCVPATIRQRLHSMSSGSTTARTLSTEPFADGPLAEGDMSAATPFAIETSLYEEGTSHGLGVQLAALLQRVWRQHWHSKVILVLELCVPLIFIALLAVLDKAFGSEITPANNTMLFWESGSLLDSSGLSVFMCYADKSQPIPGLAYCPRSRQKYLCDGNESGLPVHGLCYNAASKEPMGLVSLFMTHMLSTALAVPSLDSIILNQWLAKKAGSGTATRSMTALGALSSLGLGVSPNTRFDAIASSGLLYFAPASAIPPDFFAYLRSASQLFPYVFGGTFDTESAALAWFSAHSPDPRSRNSTWGLIVVHDLTTSFDVEILLHRSAMPQITTMAEIKYPGDYMYDGSDMYIASGYVSLQRIFYDYFLTRQRAAGTIVTPYDPTKLYPLISVVPHIHTQRRFLFDLTALLVAFVTVLAFLYPFSRMVKRMVLEKELRMREAMLIMGVRKSALWASFFISSLIENIIISVLCTLLLCLTVTVRSDAFAVFGVVMLYNTALVPLAGVVSTLFSKARLAALLTPLVYLILSIPIFVMSGAEERVVLGLAILPPTAFATLINYIANAENGPGFHRNHFRASLFFSPVPYKIMLVLAADVLLYTVLLFYLDAVLPQEWGTRAHPLFFLRTPARALARCVRRGYFAVSRRMSHHKKHVASLSTDSPSDTLREEGTAATSGLVCVSHGEQAGAAVGNITTTVQCQEMREEEGASVTRRKVHPQHSTSSEQQRHNCPASYVSRTVPPNSANDNTPASVEATAAGAAAVVMPSDCFDPTIHLNPHSGLPKRVVVEVRQLRKTFKRDKTLFAAVDDLSLNLFDGEVSVILGPNGAGKSTTINLMTGMLAPDGGDCFIDGLSIRHQLAAARHLMGFCPQHNILWPDLTCREHLEFFARVKGVKGAALRRVVQDVLRTVDLLDKQDYTPPMLSGGQKRKLSVAIAFVGGSRVVFLDEPTAGMDVAARRHTWALVRAMSPHRAIILTTHHMDEADLLGDHVALINHGTLQCAGSSLFLRSYGGASYTLHFDLLPLAVTPQQQNNTTAMVERTWRRLTRLVRSAIPEATILLCTDCELDYGLPLVKRHAIPTLLRRLEKQSNVQLGVRSYALVAPSLEDVFLRIVDGPSNPTTTIAAPAAVDGEEDAAAAMSRTTTTNHNHFYNNSSSSVRRSSWSFSLLPTSPEVRRMSVGSYRFLDNGPGASAAMAAMLNSASELAQTAAAAADGGEDNNNNNNDNEGSAVFAMPQPRRRHTMATTNCLAEMNEQAIREVLHCPTISFIQPVQAFVEANGSENDTNLPATKAQPRKTNANTPHAAVQDTTQSVGNMNTRSEDPSTAMPPPTTLPATARPRALSLSRTAMVTQAELPWLTHGKANQGPHCPSVSAGSPASQRRGNAIQRRTSLTVPAPSVSAAMDGPASQAASPHATRTETHTVSQVISAEAPAVALHEGQLSKQEAEACLNEVWQERPLPSPVRLAFMQLHAVLTRRLRYSLRDRRMLAFQIIIPVLCILIAMLLQLVHGTPHTTVVFRPDMYGERTALVTGMCGSSILGGTTDSGGNTRSLARYGPAFDTIDWQDHAHFTAYNLSTYLQQTWATHPLPRYAAVQCGDVDMAPILWIRVGRAARGKLPYVTFYNTSSRHSLPYAMHTMAELIYRDGLARAGTNAERVTRTPFRITARTLPSDPVEKRHTSTISSLLVGLVVLIPFTFLPANPVAWVVKEKEIGARHLQKMTGLHYGLYWLGTFIFDFAAYLITILLALAIFAIFRRAEYVGVAAIGPFTVSLVLYGLCSCTAAYVLSFFFHEHTAAQMAVFGGSFLAGFLFVVLVFVLGLMPATQTASLVLRWIFRVVPSYAIGEVILNLALLSQNRIRDPTLHPWDLRVTGYADIYMAAEVPLWVMLTLLWDHPTRPARIGRLWRSCMSLCCLNNRRYHCNSGKKNAEPCGQDVTGPMSQSAQVVVVEEDGSSDNNKKRLNIPPLALRHSDVKPGLSTTDGSSPLYPSQKVHKDGEEEEQQQGILIRNAQQQQQQAILSSVYNSPTLVNTTNDTQAKSRKSSVASFLIADDTESQHGRLRRITTAAYAQLPRFVNNDNDNEEDANVVEDEREHMQNYRFAVPEAAASSSPHRGEPTTTTAPAEVAITTVNSPPNSSSNSNSDPAAHSQSVTLDTASENIAAQSQSQSINNSDHHNHNCYGESMNSNAPGDILPHLRRRGTAPPLTMAMPASADTAARAGRPRLSLASVRQPREVSPVHSDAARHMSLATVGAQQQQLPPTTTLMLSPARLQSGVQSPCARPPTQQHVQVQQQRQAGRQVLAEPLYPSPPFVKDWLRRTAAREGMNREEDAVSDDDSSEDSDVQEERLAVYEDEQRWLAAHHNHNHNNTNNNSHNPLNDEQGNAAVLESPDIVRMVDLCKVYPQRKKVAVQSVSFSVMHGEVFGFLGTNGAGKSTTISILTQEQLPTSGRAYVCGHDIARESAAAMRCMGYCPQFDACFDLLTVEEHLQFYAAVRGIEAGQPRNTLTLSLLKLLGLQPYRHVVARQLSGGNRRKLSVAIALLGAPRVVCLDEPSAGMDPVARRLFWRALVRIARRCSIILTTHYLEEVDAVADCVAIMVDGKLRCIGDLPHLKHKYTRNAYELNIRLCVDRRVRDTRNTVTTLGDDPSAVRERLERFIEARFPSALLIENFNDERITYSIPATRDVAAALDKLRAQQQQQQQHRHGHQQQHRRQTSMSLCTALSPHALRTPSRVFSETVTSPSLTTAMARIVRLSDIFEVLLDHQEELHISDFSVSQMSLEQVFLRVCANDESETHGEEVRPEAGGNRTEQNTNNTNTVAPAIMTTPGANLSHTRTDTLYNSITTSGLVQSGVRAFARLRRARAARYTALAQQPGQSGTSV